MAVALFNCSAVRLFPIAIVVATPLGGVARILGDRGRRADTLRHTPDKLCQTQAAGGPAACHPW
jgi:hypothetical protein